MAPDGIPAGLAVVAESMDPSQQNESSAAGGESPYRFVLPKFEGPLDLLLHLIRVNELDITDLPVVEVARQYDEMLNLMEELDLEVAGEFLVMAATLVYIKSKLLLPVDQERIAQGLEEDPRKNLVEALLEHQRFKQAAEDLAERERQAALIFTRPVGDAAEEYGYLEVSLFDLLGAFKRVLEVAEKKAALARRGDEISLTERIEQLRRRLEIETSLDFGALMGETWEIEVLVVTFLAILELIRTGFLKAYQASHFGEIRLRRAAL
jgi:segregation and condensation protein A